MKNQKSAIYVWMIVLQSVLYGIMDPVAKIAYQFMPVYCFLMIRYIMASIIMLAIWSKTIIPELRTKPVKSYIVPALCMATAFIFSNMAIGLTAATNVAFLRSLSVLFAPLLAFIFYREKITGRDFILFGAMFVGLYLLCAKGGLSSFGLGEILSLIAAALVAGSLVFGARSLSSVSAITLSFVQSSAAIVICAAMGALTGAWQENMEFNIQVWGGLIYGSVFCTIGGYMLQNMALGKVPAPTVGVIQCLYPIVCAIVSFVMLGEKLSVAGMAGAAIIVGCIAAKSILKGKT